MKRVSLPSLIILVLYEFEQHLWLVNIHESDADWLFSGFKNVLASADIQPQLSLFSNDKKRHKNAIN